MTHRVTLLVLNFNVRGISFDDGQSREAFKVHRAVFPSPSTARTPSTDALA
jgi:hypothetical protein